MNRSIALILGLLIFSGSAHASFAEKNKRYLSPKDMMTLITQKFPVMNDERTARTTKSSCWAIGGNNTNVSGLVNPAIGLPANTQPGAGFVRWWGSCADIVIHQQFLALSAGPTMEKIWARYWLQNVLDGFRDKSNQADPFHKLREAEWKDIKAYVKDRQIRFLIEEFIGPNPVIRDLGLAKGTDELIELIKGTIDPNSTMNFFEVNQKLILAVMLREEFLTY